MNTDSAESILTSVFIGVHLWFLFLRLLHRLARVGEQFLFGALEFDGPAVINCYTTCQPEHGVADNMASEQARLAVDTRAFPLLIHDPRAGATLKKRLSLQGNPAMKEDWFTNPKTGETVDFIDFCRSEGRFSKHFDKEGNASALLQQARDDRLENWHILQELAGLR